MKKIRLPITLRDVKFISDWDSKKCIDFLEKNGDDIKEKLNFLIDSVLQDSIVKFDESLLIKSREL